MEQRFRDDITYRPAAQRLSSHDASACGARNAAALCPAMSAGMGSGAPLSQCIIESRRIRLDSTGPVSDHSTAIGAIVRVVSVRSSRGTSHNTKAKRIGDSQ